MRITSLVDWHRLAGIFAYTTRWRLDLSIPPLKIAIASPVKPGSAKEQKTCVGNGQTEIADRVPRDWLVGLTVNRRTQLVYLKSP